MGTGPVDRRASATACPAGFAGVFDALVGRRERREPTGYIIGHREFWNLDIEVTPDMLVPRPETEFVVEEVLSRLSPPTGDPATHPVPRGGGARARAHRGRRHGHRAASAWRSPAGFRPPTWWPSTRPTTALAVARRNAAAPRRRRTGAVSRGGPAGAACRGPSTSSCRTRRTCPSRTSPACSRRSGITNRAGAGRRRRRPRRDQAPRPAGRRRAAPRRLAVVRIRVRPGRRRARDHRGRTALGTSWRSRRPCGHPRVAVARRGGGHPSIRVSNPESRAPSPEPRRSP